MVVTGNQPCILQSILSSLPAVPRVACIGREAIPVYLAILASLLVPLGEIGSLVPTIEELQVDSDRGLECLRPTSPIRGGMKVGLLTMFPVPLDSRGFLCPVAPSIGTCLPWGKG